MIRHPTEKEWFKNLLERQELLHSSGSRDEPDSDVLSEDEENPGNDYLTEVSVIYVPNVQGQGSEDTD